MIPMGEDDEVVREVRRRVRGNVTGSMRIQISH